MSLWARLFGREREEAVPERIGRYPVVKPLGEGGMGRVFLARDETLKRHVAVKVLKKWDDTSQRRFMREAQAAARITHPNVCLIHEVGEERGRLFLVTEYLSGENLAQRLGRGPLSVEDALIIVSETLAALGALHEAGIVHRDVKPSNIFLTEHGVRLLDFGLASDAPRTATKSRVTATDLTPSGVRLGTPGYMAPEQVLGRPATERVDLFAVGVVLYECLAGRRPFAGIQEVSAVLHEDHEPLEDPRHEAFNPPLRRALAKAPEQRFASAREMADALEAAARTAPEALERKGPAQEPFVGREKELAWLKERLAAAMASNGSIAFVTGERGVGKSALIGEFLRQVAAAPEEVTITVGRCVESQGPGEALQPFRDALGRLLMSPARDIVSELIRTYAPTYCVQYPTALLPDPDGSLRRQAVGATKERVVRESGDFLEAASRPFPIVLYIEDLHWADSATVELMRHFSHRIGRLRVLLVCSYRPADVAGGHASVKECVLDLVAQRSGRELALGRLTPDDLQAYLDTRFRPHVFPADLAGALFERTEGLALFARSLVDLLQERGDLVREEGTWTLARPLDQVDLAPTEGLRSFVRQHIETLPEEQRELLACASVAGRDFLSPLAVHAAGGDEAESEERLKRLGDVGRIILARGEEELPDGVVAARYRFSHGLYQEVLSQDLVPSRRARLHALMAQRLGHHWRDQAPRIAAEIAGHAELGRDLERAVTFRLHAGDNEARRYAYDEAAEHYDWASRLIDKLPEESRAGPRLALLQKRGSVRHTQARFDLAIADFEALLEGAREAGSAEDERAALAGLCDALFFARQVDDMAARARELLETAHRSGRPQDATEARSRIGQVLVCEGSFGQAKAQLDGVVQVARTSGPPIALEIGLAYRGLVHYWQAEFDRAEGLLAEASAMATDRGDAFNALAFGMFVGLARVKRGFVSDGTKHLLGAISLARRNNDRFWLPRLVSRVGWVHREVLAPERAREFDTEALQILRDNPLPQAPEAESMLDMAIDEARLGHTERASEMLADLEVRIAEARWFRWVDELRFEAASAEHWTADGDRGRAVSHAGRLLGLARRLGAREYRCAAERFRARAALASGSDIEVSARDLAGAVEELRAVEAPLEIWQAARILGLVRQRLGDDVGAGEAFAESAAAVRRIAEGVEDEALREGFLGAEPVRQVLEAAPED